MYVRPKKVCIPTDHKHVFRNKIKKNDTDGRRFVGGVLYLQYGDPLPNGFSLCKLLNNTLSYIFFILLNGKRRVTYIIMYAVRSDVCNVCQRIKSEIN